MPTGEDNKNVLKNDIPLQTARRDNLHTNKEHRTVKTRNKRRRLRKVSASNGREHAVRARSLFWLNYSEITLSLAPLPVFPFGWDLGPKNNTTTSEKAVGVRAGVAFHDCNAYDSRYSWVILRFEFDEKLGNDEVKCQTFVVTETLNSRVKIEEGLRKYHSIISLNMSMHN